MSGSYRRSGDDGKSVLPPSSRYARPVFREFYKERDVVVEERRMRTDSNPVGRMVEKQLSSVEEMCQPTFPFFFFFIGLLNEYVYYICVITKRSLLPRLLPRFF